MNVKNELEELAVKLLTAKGESLTADISPADGIKIPPIRKNAATVLDLTDEEWQAFGIPPYERSVVSYEENKEAIEAEMASHLEVVRARVDAQIAALKEQGTEKS